MAARLVFLAQVHAHYSFGPLSGYLSVNYLDRFLSLYELPVEALPLSLSKTFLLQLKMILMVVHGLVAAGQGVDDPIAVCGVPVAGGEDGGDGGPPLSGFTGGRRSPIDLALSCSSSDRNPRFSLMVEILAI